MEKQAHIDYWIKSAEDDEDTMHYLFNGKKYVHALFFGHLMIEKICKALWVKNNELSVPPKTHNLLRLLRESNEQLEKDLEDIMSELNTYQLEGRYPEDINRIYKSTDRNVTSKYIESINKIKICIQEKLQ